MMTQEWFDKEVLTQEFVLAELDKPARLLHRRIQALHCGSKLLYHLSTHPNSFWTVEDLAYRLQQSPSDVTHDLQALSELRLIRQMQVAGITLYGITSNSHRQKLVRDFFDWQARWQSRLQRLATLISNDLPATLTNPT